MIQLPPYPFPQPDGRAAIIFRAFRVWLHSRGLVL